MSTTSSTKKGTKETEVIIGKAAAQLSAAVKGIAEAVKTAENLETVLGDYSLKVTNLKEEIGSLATEYAQKKADTQFNLNLEFKTNEKEFASKYLASNNLVAVSAEEYNKLKSDLAAATADFDRKLAAEVGKVKGMLENQYQSAQKLAEAEAKAKEAQNVAQITNLEAQLKFANQQTEQWREALTAERNAGIERAKASAVGSISIGQPTGGR